MSPECVAARWVTQAPSLTLVTHAEERVRVMGKDMAMYLACTTIFWLLMKMLSIFVEQRQHGAIDLFLVHHIF